jgi:hypothetical protein
MYGLTRTKLSEGVKTVYYVPDCMVSQGLACVKGFKQCTGTVRTGLPRTELCGSTYFFMAYPGLRCVEEYRLYSVYLS